MNDAGEIAALAILLPFLGVYWAFTLRAMYNIFRHGEPFPDE